MKILFNGNSITERGTLCQLKSAFKQNNVKPSDVMNSFNETEDFVRMVTEQYVCLLVMKVCEMDDIKSSPRRNDPGSHKNDSKEERRQFVKTISKEVVSFISMMPSRTTVNSVKDADLPKECPTEFCCGEGKNFGVANI